MIRKNDLLCIEAKALKGESHERWGMKKDPKVSDMANRQNGDQTIKAEPLGNEVNSRVQVTSQKPIRCRDLNLTRVTSFSKRKLKWSRGL